MTIMECPFCYATSFNHALPENKSASGQVSATPTIANIDLDRVDKNDIQALISAQNRTTHAVRAFVRFLFIQLSATTAAVTLWNIGDAFINQQECINNDINCSGNGFFYFIAGVVLIGGVVWSSAAGWEELGKSEVN